MFPSFQLDIISLFTEELVCVVCVLCDVYVYVRVVCVHVCVYVCVCVHCMRMCVCMCVCVYVCHV